MASEPLVAVLFRVNKKDPTDIFAILPDDDQGRGNVSIFDMKSGHGAGPYGQNIATSRRATPAEYARIKRAMESAPYNYNLRVYDRAPPYRLREKRLREYPLARDVGRAAGRAKGRVNMHGEPKPKFKLGDRVRVDGTSVVGEVSFNSGYDAHLGQYRYKIKDDRDGSRIHYNENSLRRLPKGRAAGIGGGGRQSSHYYSIVVPWAPAPHATEWHPTERTGKWSVITRGSFDTIKDAHAWAAKHLNGTKYSVRSYRRGEELGAAQGKTRVKLGVAGKRGKHAKPAKGRALGRRQDNNALGSKLPEDSYFMISSPEGEILAVTVFANIAFNHARRLAAERGERVAIHSGKFHGQRPLVGMDVSMRGKHEWIEVPEKGYQPPKSFRVKVSR